MSGSFDLTLDTSKPVITIYAPNYTTTDIVTDISIVSNEPLSNYQDIYTVDVNNIKRSVIFTHNVDRFDGKIVFNDYPLGIATLYASVKDEVDNISDVAMKSINIVSNNKLIALYTSDKSRVVNVLEAIRNIAFDNSTRSLTVIDKKEK